MRDAENVTPRQAIDATKRIADGHILATPRAIATAKAMLAYIETLERIAQVASKVHIELASDASDYMVMEAEDELCAALRPWREGR